MLCDKCREREATVHTTHCTDTADDVPTQQHLCDQCFQAVEPARASGLSAALQAGCRYCGGEPYAGGGSPFAGPGGAHGITFMCKRCTDEYYRLLDQKVPGFTECAKTATVTNDLISKLRASDMSAIFAEIEGHMRKWVAERE